MSKQSPFFHKHSLLSFIILTFVLSFTFGLLINIFFPPAGKHPLLDMYLVNVFVVMGPGLAAILVEYATSGRAGVIKLIRRLRPERKNAALLLLAPPVILALALSTFYFAGIPAETLSTMLGKNWELLILHFVIHIGIVGIAEELGWRGWMLPHLLQKRNPAHASLIVFVVWTLWHFPKLFTGFEIAVPFVLITFSLTVLFSYIWLKTNKNTLLLAFIHGSVNAPVFFLESQASAFQIDTDKLIFSWQLYSVISVFTAISVLFFSWKMWWTKNEKSADAGKEKIVARV